MPLAAMLLVPFPRVRDRRRGGGAGCDGDWLSCCWSRFPAVIWTWLAMRYFGATLPRTPYHPGPPWQGDHERLFTSVEPVAQLSVIVANPLRLLTLPVRSMRSDTWFLPEAVGPLPDYLYAMWALGLVAACVADLVGGAPRRWSDTGPPPGGRRGLRAGHLHRAVPALDGRRHGQRSRASSWCRSRRRLRA